MSKLLGLKESKEIECIELNLLLNKKTLSKSEIITLGDSINEENVDDLITKFEIRSVLYRDELYRIQNNRISSNRTWHEIPEYFLCLYYSYYGADDNSGGTKLFERISAEALKNFIIGLQYRGA